jgi:hypothetical protein
MGRDGTPAWSFLTNHAQVLLCIAHDPGVRLREIGETVGIAGVSSRLGPFRPSRDEIRRSRCGLEKREPQRLLGFSEWS